MDRLERMHRNTAIVIYRSLGGKENLEHNWQIGLHSKSNDRVVMTREMYEQIKKAYNLN